MLKQDKTRSIEAIRTPIEQFTQSINLTRAQRMIMTKKLIRPKILMIREREYLKLK